MNPTGAFAMYPGPPSPFRNDEPHPSPPPAGDRPPRSVSIGRIALTCGLFAWFGEAVLLMADLGKVPRAVKLEGTSFAVTGICWGIAAFGGLYAVFAARSKAGCAACVVSLLLPLPLFCLVALGGGFWLD